MMAMDLQEYIRIWRWRYLAATTVLTMLLSSYVMLAKYEHGAEETIRSFRKLRSNISQIRAATVDMKQGLATYRGLQPVDYEKKTTEALLFDRVDDLKAMYSQSVFTIEAIKDLPDSASIPFIIKLSDYNYTSFLNNLGLISAQIFPFVSIESISISTEEGSKDTAGIAVQKLQTALNGPSSGLLSRKSVVTYTIQGIVTTPKKPGGNGAP